MLKGKSVGLRLGNRTDLAYGGGMTRAILRNVDTEDLRLRND